MGREESAGQRVATATSDRREPWTVLLSLALIAILAALYYGRALDFAYFNDDPSGHFAWMEGKSVTDFFLSSADYGYYRPVVFVTLRATETAFGGHVPVADHALLLLLHATNAAMVWLLAYRLSDRQMAYAWVAALVFVSFPFNYEAVTYVASLTHPLLLFWLLLTVHLYSWGRASGRRGALWAAGLAMMLGLLTHENGLMALPALAGVEWVVARPTNWRAWLRPVWPYAIPVLLFIPLWLAIPKDSEAAAVSLTAAGSNAVPFLQSLVYPLLPVLRLDAGAVGLLALSAVVFLFITGVLAWRAAALPLWVFGLGWVVLSALPAMLFLNPDYLYGSPRLSYLTSVGVGLLWAMPVLWLWRSKLLSGLTTRARELGHLALTIGFALLIILPPLSFVRCQLDFYAEASRITRGLARAAAVTPDGASLTFVNLPYFFSSFDARPEGCPSPYPWTPIGAVVVPPYAQARDFVRFNGGPDRAVEAVAYAGYSPGWQTVGEPIESEDLRQRVAKGQVFVFDLLRDDLADLTAIWQPDAVHEQPALAGFAGLLELVAAEVVPGESGVDVMLQWRVIESPSGPVTAFAHLYGPDGSLLAQADAPPGQGYVPVTLWQPGDLLTDRYVLAVDPAVLPPGRLPVRVGLYDPQTGDRFAATAGGQPLPDNAYEIGWIERAE